MALTVLPWNQFLSLAKKQKEDEQLVANEKFAVVCDDPELSNWSAVSPVESFEDLEKFKGQLCSRPLVLRVECGKHVPIGQRLNNSGQVLNPSDLEWWLVSSTSPWENSTYRPGDTVSAQDPRSAQFIRVQFGVVIDTSHPAIEQQLREGFEVAENFIREGKPFCVEFDFNAILLDWWLTQGPKHWLRPDCLDTSYCTGGLLALTNTTPPCHRLDFAIWWSLCLPCYCLLALPYKTWRSFICQVRDWCIKIQADVKVVSSFENLRVSPRNKHV